MDGSESVSMELLRTANFQRENGSYGRQSSLDYVTIRKRR